MELRLLRAEVTGMEMFIFSQATIFYSLKRPKDYSFQWFSHVSHQQVFLFYKAILLWAWILFRIRDRWNGHLDPTREYGYFLLNTGQERVGYQVSCGIFRPERQLLLI